MTKQMKKSYVYMNYNVIGHVTRDFSGIKSLMYVVLNLQVVFQNSKLWCDVTPYKGWLKGNMDEWDLYRFPNIKQETLMVKLDALVWYCREGKIILQMHLLKKPKSTIEVPYNWKQTQVVVLTLGNYM